MEYMVRKTTLERLESSLNAFGAEGWAVTVIFIGGRDYVLVCSRSDEPPAVRIVSGPSGFVTGLHAASEAVQRFDLKDPE